MFFFKWLQAIDLHLFDGEGGDGAAMGDSQATAADTQAATSGDDTTGTPAAEETDEGEKPGTFEERLKQYNDFMQQNEDIRQHLEQEEQKKFQKTLNRRFRETKTQKAQLDAQAPLINMLAKHYGITDGDVSKLETAIKGDDSFWSEEAAQLGMTPEQYAVVLDANDRAARYEQRVQEYEEAQRSQQQAEKWMAEAKELKAKYPSFDLAADMQNEAFCNALNSGASMEDCYKVLHFDEIMAGKVQETKKQVADTVRAKGSRPAENGAKAQGAFTIGSDPSKYTLKDFEEIHRRVARGEHVEI